MLRRSSKSTSRYETEVKVARDAAHLVALSLLMNHGKKQSRFRVTLTLVRACHGAWKKLPGKKIIYAFEMRRDVAQEAIETEGRCPMEGDGKGGSKRVHVDAAYAELRDYLDIPSN